MAMAGVVEGGAGGAPPPKDSSDEGGYAWGGGEAALRSGGSPAAPLSCTHSAHCPLLLTFLLRLGACPRRPDFRSAPGEGCEQGAGHPAQRVGWLMR